MKSGFVGDDAGGDDGTGERSAADFVDAADEHEAASRARPYSKRCSRWSRRRSRS